MNTYDHSHIQTKDGNILTVRGFRTDHKILAVPVYFSSDKGSKVLAHKRYEKYIDEFAERYLQLHPEWVKVTPYGNRIEVPMEEIRKIYNPFANFQRIYDSLSKDIYRKVIDLISNIVPRRDVGFIGSSLIGFDDNGSDLDLVIRGFVNYQRIRRHFSEILLNLGGSCSISKRQFAKSIQKYQSLFSNEYNDFEKMILNRWPTIHIPDFLFCKIRFTYDLTDRIFYSPNNTEVTEGELVGTVICDAGVSFMPRHFVIQTKYGVKYTIITIFWDYSYCVSNNDRVIIRGAFDHTKQIGIIGNRRTHGIRFIDIEQVSCPVVP